MILDIIKDVTGFIKDLNLTKRDMITIIVVCLLLGISWSANYYKGEANALGVALRSVKAELKIEKSNEKINSNNIQIETLKKNISNRDANLKKLHIKLEDLRGQLLVSKTEIMKGLGDINDTKNICRAFADMGYPICGKL